MKKIVYFMIALMVITFYSCSPNTPQGVVKTYLKEIKKGEYEKAISKFDIIDSLSQENVKMITGVLDKEVSSKKGISKFKITKQKLTENKNAGSVEAKVYYCNNTEDVLNFKMIKIEGKWKIKAK